MDRNSIIGFLLIGVVLLGFYLFNKPSEEEIKERQRLADSVSVARDSLKKQAEMERIIPDTATYITQKEVIGEKVSKQSTDSNKVPELFRPFLQGDTNIISIENDLMIVKISSKGAQVVYAELKNYKTFLQEPLILTEGDDSRFNYQFMTTNMIVNSSDLFFSTNDKDVVVANKDSASVSFRIEIGEGQYLEHIYSLADNSYMLGFRIKMTGFDEIIPRTSNYIDIQWEAGLRQLERVQQNQQRIMGNAPTVYYRFENESPGKLSETKEVRETLNGKIQWVAFKQHFFTQTLINHDYFIRGMIETINSDDPKYIKKMSSIMSLPYQGKAIEEYNLSFYYGPNHFKTLNKYDMELEKQIFLGKNILRLINTGVVIPVFNMLSKSIANFGIIILLLTVIIKMLLLPLTYRSYLSTAKMKLLKPEIDAIKEKVGKDAAKMQTETMKLYRQAGVSPLGGCLPMLLQMPILIALFRFFPSSIELRQEAFLWATDLSTYDSIWDFPNGFSIPFYGDHVSLFTLLMTVSTILYTRMNSQMMASNDAMAKQMQILQYIMPIMFLGFFNNYSAGLSYYYFLANITTFGQQYLFKFFVNEDKLRQKIEDNKKKRAGTKSKWQQRLENMQKQQRTQQKGKKK